MVLVMFRMLTLGIVSLPYPKQKEQFIRWVQEHTEGNN